MNTTIIARVAMALLIDYSSVYYVDLKNNHYQCYSTNQGYQNLEIESSGEDFFGDCQRDIRAVIHPDDWDKVAEVLTRETLLQKFHNDDAVSVVYRLMIDGKPIYHTMRILHDASGEEDCLFLGVLNVDKTVRAEQATKTYGEIARTLADRYATIYYVDLETDHYIEYSASNEYRDLEIPSEGNDFFNESRENSLRVIHPEDQEIVRSAFDKDTVIAKTENRRTFQLEYRLMMNGVAHHIRLKMMRTDDGGKLIVALDNIDDEVKRQEELKVISERNVIFSHIAESLANQYGMIYYVNTETDEYIEFTATNAYKEFNISPTGHDFFGTSQRNVSMIIHVEDRERVFNALDKRTMLRKLEENGAFSMTYRLLMGEDASYTRMTVFWANDHKHIIMGVMNIDNEIERENALKKMVAENAVFSQIAESLANQYDIIYYVDMFTDHYTEFSSTNVYKSLEVQPSGDDFFAESVVNSNRVVHPDDRRDFQNLLTKSTVIQELQNKHMLLHTYRLLFGSNVRYARMSIMWANDNKHLIIGVMNIDQEVRKEKEAQQKLDLANAKAYVDELTGVKNKTAYSEAMERIQAQIDANSAKEFGILVCDVNGLKAVNDRLGHIEGDAYIRSASQLICHIWTHSPVFRIGGDEFAVILQGDDYANRHALFQKMEAQVRENKANGLVIVAGGLSEFDPATDASAAQVFERADSRMYANKALLKQ
ncbi:MAG: GGDEF domain-containing protein [Clostridia bacterium]|nr:GGDEF domain-containing protein [Clostridia bacterium]